MTQTFKITGLHCQACTKLTAKRIKALPGVEDVIVNLDGSKAKVISSRKLTVNEIKTALDDSEYGAEEYYE